MGRTPWTQTSGWRTIRTFASVPRQRMSPSLGSVGKSQRSSSTSHRSTWSCFWAVSWCSGKTAYRTGEGGFWSGMATPCCLSVAGSLWCPRSRPTFSPAFGWPLSGRCRPWGKRGCSRKFCQWSCTLGSSFWIWSSWLAQRASGSSGCQNVTLSLWFAPCQRQAGRRCNCCFWWSGPPILSGILAPCFERGHPTQQGFSTRWIGCTSTTHRSSTRPWSTTCARTRSPGGLVPSGIRTCRREGCFFQRCRSLAKGDLCPSALSRAFSLLPTSDLAWLLALGCPERIGRAWRSAPSGNSFATLGLIASGSWTRRLRCFLAPEKRSQGLGPSTFAHPSQSFVRWSR